MPFTLSHPLYAAPLRKAFPCLSLTGLVLGSMSPDFEYFIAMQPFRSIGHTIYGFFLMALPLCITFAFVFHRVLLGVIPQLLPSYGGIKAYASNRAIYWRPSTAADWLLFCFSVFLGFITHVGIDNMTHSSGWFVQRFSFLRQTVLGDEIYHILQLSLSVIGFIVPVIYIVYDWYKWRRTVSLHRYQHIVLESSLSSWLLLILSSVILMTGKLVFSESLFSLSIWVTAPITSALLGLYAAGLWKLAGERKHSGRGIACLLAIAGLILAYKLLSYQVGYSLLMWLAYIWALAGVILVSTFWCGQQNDQT